MCRKLTWLVSLVLFLGLGHSASAQWKASNPIPSNGATDVPPNVTLSWDPAYGYLSPTYDVYLGTNYDAVFNANTSDPEFLGNVDSNEYNPSGPLDFGQTYYWRADTVVPNARHKGNVWSFTTMSAPLEATNPSPADGATDVSIDVVLSWTAGFGAILHTVYFDTSSPPAIIGNQTASSYDPGTLEPGTTYYWQVDEFSPMGTIPGPVWSFTTMSGPEKATHPYPADGTGDVPLNITLSWDPGSEATSHDVHFGKGSSPPFIRNQIASDYNPRGLELGTTYYWKINEVVPVMEGPPIIHEGDVWSFTTITGPIEAMNPYPADGAEDVPIAVVLSWTAGFGATSHDVYFGTSSSPAFVCNQSSSDYSPGGLEPGTTYFWRVNEVEADGTKHTGDVWNFTTMSGPEKATNPYPADGAEDVPIAVVLGWSPGSGATSHDVYFGTSSPPAFIGNQTASDYNPGTLERGTTYWWQIDTVKQMDEFFMVYAGDLWSFTTGLDPDELSYFPFFFYQMDFNLSGTAYIDTEWGSVDFTFSGQEPIMYFNLTVNGTWQVQNIPVLSIEGVGVEQTMTYYFDLGTARGTNVTSLNYDYAFTPDILDTPPGVLEPAPVLDGYVAMWPGFGGLMPPLGPAGPLIGGKAKKPKKYAHKDFPNQECGPLECGPTAVSNSLQFLNKRHALGMDPNKITIDEMKKAMDFTEGWGCSPDTWWEIKKKYMEDNGYPITTRKTTDMNELPDEIARGQDVELTVPLHCAAIVGITDLGGGKFSIDVAHDKEQGKPGGTTTETITYDPNTNKFTGSPGFFDGASFVNAVVECPNDILLDDFELYDDDIGNRIFETWIDGLGHIYPLPGHPGNRTGSIVGNSEAPIAEQTIVYEGGQSMPFSYDNSGSYRKAFYSETERTFDAPQDWTKDGVEVLTLGFFGDPNNVAEPMYMAVEDSIGHTAVVYHNDPNAVLIDDWREWNIDLKDFADQGVNLADVNSIAIGVGDRDNPIPGGSGTIYFDDILLCRPIDVAGEGTPLEADLNSDSVVDMSDLWVMAEEWLTLRQ